jgi:hypothetical protein
LEFFMKTEEDEAFDELAKRQGDWGGGYQAKRQMAADKLKPALVWPANKTFSHWSDCAIHNAPAYPAGKCDCGVAQEHYDQTALKLCNVCGWKTLIPDECCLNCERAQPAQEPIYKITVIDNAHPKGIPFEDWVQPAQEPEMLTIAYQSGYYDGKKPWVGLTDGEVTQGLCGTRYALQTAVAWVDGVEWATKQLKEKNG